MLVKVFVVCVMFSGLFKICTNWENIFVNQGNTDIVNQYPQGDERDMVLEGMLKIHIFKIQDSIIAIDNNTIVCKSE